MPDPAATAEAVLPAPFLERLRQIVPPERYPEVLASFSAPRAVGVRVNTLRAEPEAVVAELAAAGLHLHAVEGLPAGFWIPAEERPALLASAPYAEQRLYVQDLASQVPPVLLDPQPGERVLDLCAAPGSKTRQMACLMRDEGELAAVEAVRGRFFKLKANLQAQGSTLVRTYHRDGATAWRHRPEYFDRVLVDAPCSTEGRFHTDDPESMRYWRPKKAKEMAGKQGRLLFSGIQALRPGGTLVYATCTFAPEENEAVLSRTLARFEGAVETAPMMLPPVCTVQAPLAEWQGRPFPGVEHARRLLPNALMEGFFVAKLVKRASTLAS